MSAPDRAIQDLNLDDMPVTRSSTRSTGEGRGRDQAHSGSHRMNPLARPTSSASSRYPAESSRRAPQAVQEIPQRRYYPGDFVVVNVTRIGTAVDFALVTPAAAISTGQSSLLTSHPTGARTLSEQARVTLQYNPISGDHQALCDFHRDPMNPICFHIQWLIGRLFSVLRKIRPTTAENINQQVNQLYERMSDMTNEDLLQCVRGESDDADTNIQLPSIRAEEQQARRTNLGDILSSFDEDGVPGDFLRHVSHFPLMSTSQGSLLVENDLPATIFRLAMQDDHIYSVLHDLVPGELRAQKYYETQLLKATHVLESQEPSRQSAKNLRKIVHEMYEDRSKRREKFPQDPQETIDAILAEILMNVVGMVVDDHDISEDSTQEGTPSFYVRLIGNPRRGTQDMDGWTKDMFVLDRYQELWNRNQERFNHRWPAIRQRWASILRSINATATSNHDPANYYAGKIEEIIQALNGRHSDPSVSAQRFRMPQVDQPFEDEDE